MDEHRHRIDGAATTVGELAAVEPILDIPGQHPLAGRARAVWTG
ncbi:hypothetical protein [Streptomyces sp. NPDC002676]